MCNIHLMNILHYIEHRPAMLQTICKLNVFLVLMNSTALICECIRAEAGRFYFMLSDFNWFIIVMSVQIILTVNFSSNSQLNIFGGDLTF